MRYIYITGILLFFNLALSAQDLDPTVEVTREYEGKLVEAHKPSLEMSIPDTLTRFALDFDYSVFENPYQGSYEFSPYTLSMKPSVSDTGEKQLYLRAGVGYQLHPEFDLVWSPKIKSKMFNMDIYATHKSFIGNYLKMTLEEVSDSEDKVVRVPKGQDDRFWFGYDILSRAGMDFRFDTERMAVNLKTGYYGVARRNLLRDASLNAFDASFGLTSKPESKGDILYDIDMAYRFAQDNFSTSSYLNEHLFDFDVYFGPLLKTHNKIDFKVGVDFSSYDGLMSYTIGEVSVSPRYVHQSERANLCLGVLLAKMIGSDDLGLIFKLKDQIIYPNISFDYVLIPDAMKFHIAAKGGNTINTYSSIVEKNHHMTYASVSSAIGNTLERINASAGFDGRITSRFRYNLMGGYVNYGSALLDAVVVDREQYAYMEYAPYNKWFLSLGCALEIDSYRFDGKVSYDRAWGDIFETGDGKVAVLKPAAFNGEAAFEYNWNRRIFGGIDCRFMTARRGAREVPAAGSDAPVLRALSIPGFADVGIYGEYVTSLGLSAWLKVGNLLNMTVQRNPLYAEKGVNFTVGICYSL